MTAEARQEQSLRDYLTTKNPDLVTLDCRTGKPTSSKHWTRPKLIKVWEEFNFDNLERDYHQVLENRYHFQDFREIPPFPFREISDEHSLERFLSKWTQSVVCAALEVGQQDNVKIYMASGGQAGFRFPVPIKVLNAAGIIVPKYYPDWAAVRKDNSHALSRKNIRNLLPGDTKLGTIWHSNMIPRGKLSETKYKPKDLLPILQILNYCLYSHSSFGYLLTDQELVAVRVKTLPQPRNPQPESTEQDQTHDEKVSETTVEFKAIPWTAFGGHCLTVNLSLWWLHLMANSDNTIAEAEKEIVGESFYEMLMDYNLNASHSMADKPRDGSPQVTGSKRKRPVKDTAQKETPKKRVSGKRSQ